MPRPVVAVDLDGTIAQYDGWAGEEVIGDPIEGAKEFLVTLSTWGFDIVIFTARAGTETGVNAVWAWLQKLGVQHLVDEVTNVNQYRFAVMIDDRAIHAYPQDLDGDVVAHYNNLLETVKKRCGVKAAVADDSGSQSGG